MLRQLQKFTFKIFSYFNVHINTQAYLTDGRTQLVKIYKNTSEIILKYTEFMKYN